MHPLYNFQGDAQLSVLAFLATAALLAGLGVACVVLLARRRGAAALRLAAVAAGLGIAYLGALSAVSLTTRPRSVPPGGAKYFCELDCHLAYAVVGSEGVPVTAAPASDLWQVVTLRVWFDPSTTSPRRGDAPLYPNPRRARLRDSAGREYPPSAAGLDAYERAAGRQTSLDAPLRPGGSYTTALVFRVPAARSTAELLLRERDPVTHLLIGHENSFFHPPVPFRLGQRLASTAVRP